MSSEDIKNIINDHFKMHEPMADLTSEISEFAKKLTNVLKNDGTDCGNGGSASDSQLAAELVGRFEKNRAH